MATEKKMKKNSPKAVSFPLRVACVDMGSNAIRFLAAEFSDEVSHEVLAADRRPVRLGHSVFLSGVLDQQAMDAAVAALADFKKQMDDFGIVHYRAVATSAVRESKNGGEFVKRIKKEAGLELEVISGSEEARLVHTAVVTPASPSAAANGCSSTSAAAASRSRWWTSTAPTGVNPTQWVR